MILGRRFSLQKWLRNPNRNWASIAGSKTSYISSICTTAPRSMRAGSTSSMSLVPRRPTAAPWPRRQQRPHRPRQRSPEPGPGEELQPLRGVAGKIAENMTASLSIPLATSQRTIAVKVMDENRRIINQHRTLVGQEQGLLHAPDRLGDREGAGRDPGAQSRLRRKATDSPSAWCAPQVNLGIAVDVAGKDGARSLMVPNIKNAGALNFPQYVDASTIWWPAPARAKLTPADFQGTTISLTNPGTVGTMASHPAPDARTGRHHRHRRHRLSGRVPGRRRGDARHARHQQGDDADLHLRSSRDSGRGIRHVPGQACRRCSTARTVSTRRSSPTCACRTSRCAGRPDRQAAPARRDRRALRRDRQGSGRSSS